MRTPISIQGLFMSPSGSPASGTICVEPTTAASSGETYYPQEPVCGTLDESGRIAAQSLRALDIFASDDSGVEPNPVIYTFTLQVNGQRLISFNAAIPVNSTAIDEQAFFTEASNQVLLAQTVVSEAMIGQALVATGPGSFTVTAIDFNTNSLTISGNSAVTGVAPATIGGAVDFLTLMVDLL